jgi:hypothetical protein
LGLILSLTRERLNYRAVGLHRSRLAFTRQFPEGVTHGGEVAQLLVNELQLAYCDVMRFSACVGVIKYEQAPDVV